MATKKKVVKKAAKKAAPKAKARRGYVSGKGGLKSSAKGGSGAGH